MRYGIGSSQCQRCGLIRPQGDLWAALRAARSGCESFDAERQIVTQGEDEKNSPTSCVPNLASMQLTNVVLAVSRALSWMCQETAISGYS